MVVEVWENEREKGIQKEEMSACWVRRGINIRRGRKGPSRGKTHTEGKKIFLGCDAASFYNWEPDEPAGATIA